MLEPSIVSAALPSLDGPRLTIAEAERIVPSAPGLYAVHGDPSVWQRLALGDPPDDRPLYVGKAERSLADRDVRTHFSTGKTGWSTLRRSLAGLLADELRLEGQPRNLANPEGFANFGLEEAGDARLTGWMLEHLRLAAWPSPVGVVLDEIETVVLAQLMPPLNLDKVATPWRAQVRSGRRRLAAQGRAWMPPTSREPISISEEATTSRRLSAGAVGRVVGIDVAGKNGWVGVVLEAAGFQGARLGNLREIIDWAEPVDAIGVDIPIGHVGGGSRRADVEARRFVGARGSSVFAAPPAEVLDAATYGEANEMLTAMGVPMLSRQAWALVPKIIEAASIADTDPRVFEVHPEVSFCELAGECVAWPKKSWNGLLLRRRLLAEAGVVLPDVIADVGGAVSDDIVDAAVAAWSARRIATETARSFPDPPEEFGGRRVAIWC